jgi:uncharacterized membrane protein
MKVKILVGALILLVAMNLAALGAFLMIQTHHRPPVEWSRSGSRGRLHERLIGQLGPEERKKVFESMRAFHEKNGDLMRETRQLEDAAISAMREDPVPRARVDSLLQQISANRLEIARRATDEMISLGKTLSPEQREHLLNAIMHLRGDGPRPGRRGWHDKDADDRP